MILDKDYASLNADDKVRFLSAILQEVVDSSITMGEQGDAASEFADYDWEPREGVDLERFQILKQMALEYRASESEFNELMDMVSGDGHTHVYYVLRKAKVALESAVA